MMAIVLLCCIYLVSYFPIGYAEENSSLTEPVATRYGKVVGRRIIPDGDRPVNAFQGIPFAKPPLGELRFKKPQPPNPWNGTLETTKFAAKPISDDRIPVPGVPVSEDCLYLNVFSPAWPEKSELIPVMVIIHGGGYFFESAATYGDIGIAQHLVAANELIVVTLEFRLGFLGFFATDNQGSDDNVGLWDMVMGLEWVRDNIQNFGGDPSNVTLVGQSSGGTAADLLFLSPKIRTRKLFHRVITMSGNANFEWALQPKAVEYSRNYAAKLGVQLTNDSANMIDDLRKIDAKKFIIPWTAYSGQKSYFLLPIAPHVDGDILPDTVSHLRQSAPNIPRIIGATRYDGILTNYQEKTLDELKGMIATRIPQSDFPNYVELRQKALELYIQPYDYEVPHALRLALAKFYSDFFVGNGVQSAVLKHLEAGNKEIYLYSFDFLNPASVAGFPIEIFSPTHCLDLNYFLGINIFTKYEFDWVDKRMIRILTKLWSNFAKYGNPNGSPSVPSSRVLGDFKWLPATLEHPTRYLVLSPGPNMAENFHDGRPLFWVELEKQRSLNQHSTAQP